MFVSNIRLLPVVFVNVSDNLIGDAGATAVARALVNASSLEELSLSSKCAIKR